MTFTTRPELAGTFGMVASTHWLASSAGMAVLEYGGNAFDAAAAAGFTLHVVEPHMNGPGGEVPILFTTAADRTPVVLCGQGPAPAGATLERFRGEGLELVPGTGLLAATVPGAVGAWLTLLRDHGTMPLADVLEYAIGYAERGHPVSDAVVTTIATVEELFRTHWPTSARRWLPAARAGELVRNPALAETYRRLAAEAVGPSREARLDAAMRAWYEGFVAEELDAHCRTETFDDSGQRRAGLLTGDDLAAWRPGYEEPVSLDVFGWRVCKAGAWSQGPVLLQQLATLHALGELPPPGSAELIHRVVEVTKLCFADRDANYGDDPSVPLDLLLSPAYAAERAALVTGEAGTPLRPGAGRLPAFVTEGADVTRAGPGIGEPTLSPLGTTRGDTCHLDVADRWGNVVSATPSGGWLQSSPTVERLGFCLGTRAQMFWLEEGLPNSLAPGKRPRTTLSPSLAVRDEEILSFGTPGGDQQDQWQLGFFLNHAGHGMNLQEAIDAPVWHTTAFPSSFYPRTTGTEVLVESRVGTEALDDLRRRGHDVTVADPWSLGRMSSVAHDRATGLLRGAANPRAMQGYAVGR
ncbi:gamma-glutamyltransferase family protein [Actinophytocola gossypii]|uniref:Gamma-glutamyltransferase family protein n=1 Tax=Actinophytocola gossypii TaxID=2812003 RepID=A0ABT2J689_9PSEU|nr:gamma-glutamyltransferase family protein [Actinophytocola gossypii]MCT2583380.1 gamma-glutamyltransferase family protein [Actinophytocola gossypii]